MIKIKYNNENSFELLFVLKDYIPQKYFDINKDGSGAELYFYRDLLKNNKQFKIKKQELIIYDVEFSCEYKGIPFKMYYDTDWDLISFVIDTPIYLEAIAESIKHLVEIQKKLLEYIASYHICIQCL